MFLQGSNLHWMCVSCLSQAWEQNSPHWTKVGCFCKALISIDLVSHVCPKHGSKTSHFGWRWDVFCKALICIDFVSHVCPKHGSKTPHIRWRWDDSARLWSALIWCLMSVPSMGARLPTLDEGGMFQQGSHLHKFGVSCLSQAWEQDFSLWMKMGCFCKALICIEFVSHVCPKHGSKTPHIRWRWDDTLDTPIQDLWTSKVHPNNETQWDMVET